MESVSMPNNTIMSSSNLTQVNTTMSVGNIQPPGQTSGSNNVFNGFYSSGFNSSINNLEASLQWLSETRVPNNSLMTDKNLNCNATHSVPSHSCCVNRIDNLGMCSPLPGETYRSSCRDSNFQTRPSSLSLNVMDSVQSWFNLQPIQSNQQYSGKFPDQNLNCAQMNLPVLEQSDLKQADINITMPDAYFEPHLSSNANKSIGPNLNEISAKIPDVNDVQSSSMKVQNNNFQSTILPREWKQTSSLQANYVSSPTFFNSISDSPDHFIYSLPPPTSSYCMPTTDNIASSSNKQQNCYQQPDKHQNTIPQLNCRPNYIDQTSQLKVLGLPPLQQSTDRNEKTFYEKPVTMEGVMSSSDVMKTIQSSSSAQKDNEVKMNSTRKFPDSLANYTLPYLPDVGASNETIVHSGISQKLPELSKTIEQNLNDDSSSGSDESNIIVEESDETEEMESVTSIEEMKKSLLSSVELRCLVCNVKSSQQTPATQFIHMNDSFPVTSASRTPVASKLIQIIPADLKHFLKLHNSFMCRRCLNLIETVEVLEVKLTSVKQTLSENFSKTIQCFLPATPIIEIEDGKAEIVDKEIIKSIEKTGLEGALVNFSETTLYLDIQPAKKACVIVDNLEEVDDVDDGIDDNTDTRDDFSDEGDEADDDDGEKRTCNICGKTLSSAKTFKRHMEIHTGAFSFYCETCGKGFNKKSSLETHLRTHSGDNRFQCEKCGQTYSQKHRLETHLRKHAADFSLHCDVCGKGFVQKRLLEKHALTHTDYRPFVCERCGFTFSKKSGLKAHLDVCEKKEFPCDCCSQVFTSQANLKKHKVSEHCDEPPACCEICGKIFAQRKDLKPHMRSHSDDKPFRCEICDKSYKTRGDLNYHSKIHNVDKLFKCSICDKSFARKQVYDDHMSKHAGNRNYKCTECDRAFFEKGKLQKHMSIHNGGVKRKTCPVCNKEVQHMNVHMRIHSGEKPYVCKICGLAFSINRTLMRHIQSKHYTSA